MLLFILLDDLVHLLIIILSNAGNNKHSKNQNSWVKEDDLAVGPFARSSSVAIIQVQVCHFCREWTRFVGEVSVRDKAGEADHAAIIPGNDQICVTRSVRIAITELADFADKPGEKPRSIIL